MPHKPENTQSLTKAFDHYRNSDHKAFREKKRKSIYLWGRKTGADNIVTEAYRDGWDRVFGKEAKLNKLFLAAAREQAEPDDYDGDAPRKRRK